ncbi:MAG TPA: hypothetical protein VG184_02455 [Acidimicrobiales bacterium]|jgi:hypothetical protein|nr:hypothetical protein [Acidimicrobiales bacterium]
MLISGSGVGAVLRDVAAAGERVLGLDGFELDSSVIHPRLDLIFDPSRGPVRDPVSVVDEWGHDVWVDVTLGTAAGT